MRAVSASLSAQQPSFKREWSVWVDPFERGLVPDAFRQAIAVAFGAVVMVLVIAAANIANLLLAKGVARRQEMAVRTALGATRGRLVAQSLTESLVLCLFGGIAGVALAYFLIDAAAPLLKTSLPATAAADIDPRVLGFAAAVDRRGVAPRRPAAFAADVDRQALAGRSTWPAAAHPRMTGCGGRSSSRKSESRWCSFAAPC